MIKKIILSISFILIAIVGIFLIGYIKTSEALSSIINDTSML